MNKRFLSIKIIFFVSVFIYGNLFAQKGKACGININPDQEKIVLFDYNIQLFPGQQFTGYWYFWSFGGELSSNFHPSPTVTWVNMSPSSFTSTSCSDIVPVAFTFVAPSVPGVYTTSYIDQNNSWDPVNINLTVTNTPTAVTLTVNSTINEPVLKTETVAITGLPNIGCVNPYFPGSTAEVSYMTSTNVNWLTFDPSNFILSSGNPSVLVTKTFLSDGPGEFSTYEIREAQWTAFPRFIKWVFKVKKKFEVVRPGLNERWIAEKPDTVKWTADTLRNVQIYFSNDGDDEYTLITAVGEQDTFFIWEPPDNFHSSSNSKIKIADALDESNFDVSDPFTYRAFDLVRKINNQTLEVFSPASNGWSFENSGDIMWPQEWYQQFDYRNINDPFTNQPYRADFIAITRPNASDFPDWPLFVETYGQNKCYSGGRPTQSAMEAWKSYKESWDGSCFGFPTSSLLAFEHLNDFVNLNQGIPAVNSIFNLFLTNTIRKTVNKYFLYQSDASQIALVDGSTFNVSPRETLSELKEMFLDETGDHRTISLLNNTQPGAHTLLPVKLQRDDVNHDQFRLYVYNCNFPGETGQFILIDSLANSWEEFLEVGYGSGNNGLFLNLPSGHFLQTPILSLLEAPSTEHSLFGRITVYVSSSSGNFIISETGDTLGYGKGKFLKQIPDGIPIIPDVAVEHPPIGYRLDNANYKIEKSNFTDSISSLLIHRDNILYAYERLDANAQQTDVIYFGDGIGIKNTDSEEKKINLESIIPVSDAELTYNINLSLHQQDSAKIQTSGNNLKSVKYWPVQIL